MNVLDNGFDWWRGTVIGCSESLVILAICVGWVERSEPHHAGLVGLAALDPPYIPEALILRFHAFGSPCIILIFVYLIVRGGVSQKKRRNRHNSHKRKMSCDR